MITSRCDRLSSWNENLHQKSASIIHKPHQLTLDKIYDFISFPWQVAVWSKRIVPSRVGAGKYKNGENTINKQSMMKPEGRHIIAFEFTTTLNDFYRSFCNDTRSWGFRKHSIDYHRAKNSIAEFSFSESFLFLLGFFYLSQIFRLKGHFKVYKQNFFYFTVFVRSFLEENKRKRNFRGLKWREMNVKFNDNGSLFDVTCLCAWLENVGQ